MAATRVVARDGTLRTARSTASAPPAFVVDASVSAAWCLPDEATAYTVAALQCTAAGGVWVPALWSLEMANLLQTAQRRRRITAAKRAELAAGLDALHLRISHEPVSLASLDALAAAQGLSAYDACYLELAMRRRLPLATLDTALRAAMKRCGVPLPDLPG